MPLPKNILVTGASGRIGYEIAKKLAEKGCKVAATYLDNQVSIKNVKMFRCDLSKDSEVKKLFAECKPEVVIHCASMTNVDECETEKAKALMLNVNATEHITKYSKQHNTKIIFVSTSFVFDGSKKAYVETDAPHPMNHYGQTKLMAEKVVQASEQPFLILRTDQPYGPVGDHKKPNFVTTTLHKLEAGSKFQIFSDWFNNPTYIPDFVDCAIALLEKEKTGIYHVIGPDFISRTDWAALIATIFGKDKKLIEGVKSDASKVPAKRPNANLSNKKAEKDSGIKFRSVQEGIKQMKPSMIKE
jgi:dTDP-4-dehydrorhamnose reductase